MNKTQLKDVALLITKGTTPSTIGESFVKEGINYIKSESIRDFKYLDKSLYQYIDIKTNEKLSRSQLFENDLLFSIAGAYLGKLGIVTIDDIPANTNQAVGVVRLDHSKANVHYLYYYFSQKLVNEHINRLSSQSSQPNLNLTLLSELVFDGKSLYEQAKIAKVLSDLDSKIELNYKINSELEAVAKLIYDYWFVQFDFPISKEQAEVMGKPELEGKPYKVSGGKMVYNEELKRDIPEGWGVDTISSIIKKDKSGDWGKEEIQGNYTEAVTCIRGTDLPFINGNEMSNPPNRFILEKNEHKILDEYDLIIEISGGSPTQSTGRAAFIIEETIERFQKPLICSNFCKAITLDSKYTLYNFFYIWMRLYDAGVYFGWEGKTSGIKNLLFDSFVNNYKIEIAPLEYRKAFFDKIHPIHQKIQKNLQENQKLAELRDWLLPMLMNGQVTVGEIEEEVEVNMAAEPKVDYG